MIRLLALCIAAYLLAACATVPMASPDADAAGKAFAPPPPGKAALYVVRDGIVTGSPALGISVGQRQLGDLTSFTWLRVELAPCRYQMRVRGMVSVAGFNLELAACETRYVLVEPRFGGGAQAIEIPADEGQRVARKGQRALEIP